MYLNDRVRVHEDPNSPYEMTSTLVVSSPRQDEMGKYTCVAKNSLGVDKTIIRTYSEWIEAIGLEIFLVCFSIAARTKDRCAS